MCSAEPAGVDFEPEAAALARRLAGCGQLERAPAAIEDHRHAQAEGERGQARIVVEGGAHLRRACRAARARGSTATPAPGARSRACRRWRGCRPSACGRRPARSRCRSRAAWRPSRGSRRCAARSSGCRRRACAQQTCASERHALRLHQVHVVAAHELLDGHLADVAMVHAPEQVPEHARRAAPPRPPSSRRAPARRRHAGHDRHAARHHGHAVLAQPRAGRACAGRPPRAAARAASRGPRR